MCIPAPAITCVRTHHAQYQKKTNESFWYCAWCLRTHVIAGAGRHFPVLLPPSTLQTRSTPEVWDPKMSGFYKGRLSNKVWLFFTIFGFQEKFESNRTGSRKNLNRTDRENLNRTDLSNRSLSPSRSLICKRKPIAAKEPS